MEFYKVLVYFFKLVFFFSPFMCFVWWKDFYRITWHMVFSWEQWKGIIVYNSVFYHYSKMHLFDILMSVKLRCVLWWRACHFQLAYFFQWYTTMYLSINGILYLTKYIRKWKINSKVSPTIKFFYHKLSKCSKIWIYGNKI